MPKKWSAAVWWVASQNLEEKRCKIMISAAKMLIKSAINGSFGDFSMIICWFKYPNGDFLLTKGLKKSDLAGKHVYQQAAEIIYEAMQ